MKKCLVGLFFLSLTFNSVAQKINLDKWAKKNIDSLRKIGVDTALYYHRYCGECIVTEKPPDIRDTTSMNKQCEIDNAWVQLDNIIVYQQQGRFYSLTFNCNYSPKKSELKKCNSTPYFISIIPVLNRRDKLQKAMFKQRKFFPPVMVDGGYEEAYIYLNNIKQSIYLQDYQKTDKAWRSFFWIDKETGLFELVAADIRNIKK